MTDTPQVLLAHHLKSLRLPTFLREYDKLARQCAAEGVDHVRYLVRLTELELIDRERRMVERRIRQARFPAVKSLDSFDFKVLPSLNKMLVQELARCEYVERRENVIALGPSGTGKTHVALGLGLAACQKGLAVGFITAAALVHELMEARDEKRLLRFQKQLAKYRLLIIDELGFVPLSKTGARLEGLANPGSVCVSSSVHDQVVNKIEVSFDDLGPQKVKNIGEPVRAFRIRLDAAEASVPVQEDAPPLPDKPSIAVLPFDNISGDPEQEYFADGITEDIITELSKISGLVVIARHSAFTYKGKSVTLKQVGRELGVRCVLEGSVRKAGNRLRITAQLINAVTDHHLWAERYDRNLDDIFAVQDEVARKVAEALEVALTPSESERLTQAPTDNLEAYDVYLRARNTRWPPTRLNLLSARTAFERVIEMDPAFAGGYAGKSLTHSFAVLYGYGNERDDRLHGNSLSQLRPR